MKRLNKKITMIMAIAFVIIVNTAIFSLAKDKDKVEDKLINEYNKEFRKENNRDKSKEFKQAVKISKRIQVKTISQSNSIFSLVDSKENFEVVFILDKEDSAVGLSIILDGEVQTISETESEELLKLYNTLPDIYENEKKIKIYALPTFVAVSLIVEKGDGSFDVWPCQEVSIFIKNVKFTPYQKYSLEQFFELLIEEKKIQDNNVKVNNEEVVY